MSSKNNPTFSFWESQRGAIKSRKGGWRIGHGVFSHGYDMMNELVGHKTYFQVMVLNATGKMVDKYMTDWMEAVYICLSWPDPRIWCNQIGALGGTMRSSVVAATSAGIMAGDSKLYGQKTLIEGARFIRQALFLYNEGVSVSDIVEDECNKYRGKPYITGYARPIAKGDERVVALERFSRELGISPGEHLLLARKISDYMVDRFGESINVNGYCTAVMSDFGFSPEDIYRISTLLMASGITACHLDTLARPPEAFLPLRCDDIDYQGPAPKEVPGKK